jgi:flagellar L-ring protein precursor FlgH
MKRLQLVAIGLALSGCASDPREVSREPTMTAVGSGLAAYEVPAPLTALTALPASAPRHPDSLWSTTSRSLYGDPRALHVGDTLTVEISLDDRAELDNRSDRTRDSTIGLDLGVEVPTFGLGTGLGGNVGSGTGSAGRGSIARSEALELSIAAVVTSVLPNGNLVVNGSQEVRVNYEMRVLSIAGIVRPFDISSDNTIAYEKIAEARLAYGGRGRLSEVQQPGSGQQLYDMSVPF